MAKILICGTNEYRLIFPKHGTIFDNEDLDGMFGQSWIIEELASWLGNEYSFLSAHKYRWVIYKSKYRRNQVTLNVKASDIAEHDIFGDALILESSEIDFDFLDTKGHYGTD